MEIRGMRESQRRTQLTYFSAAVSLMQDEFIVAKILNPTVETASAHIVVYSNGRSPRNPIVWDEGWKDPGPMGVQRFEFSAPQDGDYWISIEVTSIRLIPTASFLGGTYEGDEPMPDSTKPIVLYRPGDFNVFAHKTSRKKLRSAA